MTYLKTGRQLASILSIICALLFVPAVNAADDWQQQASALLKRALNLNASLLLELDNYDVKAFYRARGYRPLWFDKEGRLLRADELVHALHAARDHGLEPTEYFLADIKQRMAASSMQQLVALELWLTAALYRYGNDLYSGRLDPYAIDADWHIPNTKLNIVQLLQDVSGKLTIAALLAGLAPDRDGYRGLKRQLEVYRGIARNGGWGKLRSWPKLALGARHDGVLQLRQRLQITGDLAVAASGDEELFDEAMEQAVKRFQRRHGLDDVGTVGGKTLAALNVSVQDKIEQIRLNMERWRWLPRELGRRYVAVNMTGFELDIVEDEETVLTMPVVIGKPFQETPALSGVISSLVYNPYWTLTKNTMWESFIPGQMSNPNYLSARNIKVYQGWADPVEVDPKTVDWSALDPRHNSPYWMRQDPGPGNALGQIKFLFSNGHYIYLHGSPQKHLFDRTVRTYSHGCIRVKDPATLAEYLQGGPDPLVQQAVASKINSGVNEKVILPVAVPVYLMYWTAWAGDDGVVNFRDDIYGRDANLRTRLNNQEITEQADNAMQEDA